VSLVYFIQRNKSRVMRYRGNFFYAQKAIVSSSGGRRIGLVVRVGILTGGVALSLGTC
jgi:hypothetical protein